MWLGIDSKTPPSSLSTAFKTLTLDEKEYVPVEEFAEFKGITAEKVIQMIRDGFYQGKIIDDHWYVAYSEILTPSQIDRGQTVKKYPIQVLGAFFSKLARGDFGLAKTYWLYGVLVITIIRLIVESTISSAGVYVIFVLGITAYEVLLLNGIWRASNKYIGPKVWVMLAKFGVMMGWTWVVANLISAFKLVAV